MSPDRNIAIMAKDEPADHDGGVKHGVDGERDKDHGGDARKSPKKRRKVNHGT